MAEKTTILNVIGKRPTGGIGSFCQNYQKHFSSSDLQIDYLLFDDNPSGRFDEQVKKLGSRVFVLPSLKNRRLFLLWRAVDRFMGTIGCQYTAIHLHSANISFMCLASAKKYGVTNRIVHSHATVYSDNKLKALRNKVLCRNLSSEANHYLACSKLAGQFLFGKEAMSRVLVFNNAIECDLYQYSPEKRAQVRKRLGWAGRTVIGGIGRLCQQKNQLFLLDIFSRCLRRDPDALLVLVGDGPLRCALEQRATDLGIRSNTLFLGHREDVDDLLQGLDVLVMPSLFEGLPLTGIEAQASGLPLVASSSITRELDVNGVRFVDLDASPEEWARVTLSSVGSIDRKGACTKVKNGGFDINREAERLQNFYLSLGSC